MKVTQKIIKYLAIMLAFYLIYVIFSAVINGISFLTDDNNGEKYDELVIISTEVDEINNLDIQTACTSLEIKKSDIFKVETNNPNIKFKNENGTIKIEDTTKKVSINNTEYVLIVTLPEEMVNIEKIEIEAGAGILNIANLNANNLELELGAGNVTIENLTVDNKTKIVGGAGKTEIYSSKLNNLTLEMGVGEFTLNSVLTGENEIEAGVGKVKLDLIDDLESYTIKATKGLGSITINGESIVNEQEYGKGPNYINIEGGVGSIEIE